MRAGSVGGMLLAVVVLAVVGWGGGGCGVEAAATGDECGSDFQKVAACLTYATGKAEAPGKQCCDSVGEIKESKPKCLCYVVLQVHKGTSPQLKNMGIQESRLLQLPSACRIANASATDCPRLLQIPPSSPDYAVFSNSSTAAAATAGSSSSPATAGNSNVGLKQGPHFTGSAAVVALTHLFFYVVPTIFA